MLDLSTLNPPQREAVETIDGPVLVLAGAGSGKTRVIVHRIAWMIEQGIPPSRILAMTFTNKAASEMRERVGLIVGSKAAHALTVSTFHAFGCEVLRRYIDRLGYPRKFVIADASDQLALVKRAMEEVKVDDREFDARRVLVEVSRAKSGGLTPQPLEEGRGDDYDLITAEVFPRYELALKVQGSVDFEDLIRLPMRLMREFPEVREALRDRYQYLLVDEYQDTNRAQLELLVELAGDRKNVCAVGDDDQSIYSWRGAEVENILAFDRHFPGVREIRLEQNYRSTQTILDAANGVIARNEARKAKKLWTAAGVGERIQVVACADDDEEGRFIAKEIRRLMDEGRSPREIAILYRTNLQSRPIEEGLRGENVPYDVVGGQEFFDRREIKDLLAYLKVFGRPNDEVSILRIVNVPARGIGDTTMERLVQYAQEEGITSEAAMRRAHEIPTLPHGSAGRFQEFIALIDRYRKAFTHEPVDGVTRALVDELGLRDLARQSVKSAPAGARKAAAIDGFLDSVTSFARRDPSRAGLTGLLQRFALEARDDDAGPKEESVTVMTLHAAKGLEWPVVFLCGMEEDLLPHGGMQGEAQNLDEERRLAYVGITRARERLYLTRAANRLRRGRSIVRTPSRFLEDIPEALQTAIDPLAAPKGDPGATEVDFFASLKASLKAQAK